MLAPALQCVGAISADQLCWIAQYVMQAASFSRGNRLLKNSSENEYSRNCPTTGLADLTSWTEKESPASWPSSWMKAKDGPSQGKPHAFDNTCGRGQDPSKFTQIVKFADKLGIEILRCVPFPRRPERHGYGGSASLWSFSVDI